MNKRVTVYVNKKYVIRNVTNDLYWSNEWGWGSREGCDVFTQYERDVFNLPTDGEWSERDGRSASGE
jgi:hypothetical protein